MRYFLDAHLAGQHDLGETGVFEKADLGRVAIVGLRAGVQLDRRQIEFEQPHVLDDQCIGAGFVNFPGQLAGFFKLIVAQDGVERDENLCPEAMCKIAQASDFGDIVASAIAGAESRATDIDGVGPVLDGFDAEIGVFGRREEFERVLNSSHGALVRETGREFFEVELVQDGFGAFAGDLLRSTAFFARF